jgi:hypothetical protein
MAHRANINPALDPICRLCYEEEEESQHIIMQCLAIAGQRLKYFGEYYLEKDWAWEPALILNFLRDPELIELEKDPEGEYKFLQNRPQ